MSNRLNVTAPKMPNRTSGFYARLEKQNRVWLHQEAKAQGFRYTAEFLNSLISAARGTRKAKKAATTAKRATTTKSKAKKVHA